MPLLKRKAFAKCTTSEFLRDDDEVFHCEITGEIFKDYEEYCERIILVNSMVWSCEMTGRPRLTYAEALQSERAARRALRAFPAELRAPLLLVAARTRRTALADMLEDVFAWVRERYFVGESVEACLEGDQWTPAIVLSVTATHAPLNSEGIVPASAYCYEVQATEGQVGSVPHDRVRRRNRTFTRDKHKLFLKQHVRQGADHLIQIKQTSLDKLGVSSLRWEQVFTGALPVFPSAKRLLLPPAPVKTSAPKKRSPAKQQSIDKFVNRTNAGGALAKPEGTKRADGASPLSEQMRRKKEQGARLAAFVKEWHRAKEDLQLEDHAPLPPGEPLPELRDVPGELAGELLALAQFVREFRGCVRELPAWASEPASLRHALTSDEGADALSALFCALLAALFRLQREEAEDEEPRDASHAAAAARWARAHLGVSLHALPRDAHTVSEVLRLHLLSSGCEDAGTEHAPRWRVQQRGSYAPREDPGAELTRSPQGAETLRRLATTHVARLPLADKLRLLAALHHQLLTYSAVRDHLEERLERARLARHELKQLQAAERRREAEACSERARLRREGAPADALEQLERDGATRAQLYETKSRELSAKFVAHRIYLGMDRAHRRYWALSAARGLLAEAGEAAGAPCQELMPKPRTPHNQRTDTNAYLQRLFRLQNGEEREESGGEAGVRDLSLCTGTGAPGPCPVHGATPDWRAYREPERLDELLTALNPRGVREGALLARLTELRERLLAEPPAPAGRRGRTEPPADSLGAADEGVEVAVEVALREHILELEERVNAGSLGALRVPDREAWRGALLLRSYDRQEPAEVPPPDEYRAPGHQLEEGSLEAPAAVRDLAAALLQVERAVHRKFLRRPLGPEGDAEGGCVAQWERALLEARSLAAVALHARALHSSVAWRSSVQHAACRACRRKNNPEQLLLCDACNRGHHTYCLEPKLMEVPDGEWFCPTCRPPALEDKAPVARKRRKLYTEEEDSGCGEEEGSGSSSEDEAGAGGVCGACGSGGRLGAVCEACGGRWHAECARPAPPPRHRAGRAWTCRACLPRNMPDWSEESDAEEEGEEPAPAPAPRSRSRRLRSAPEAGVAPLAVDGVEGAALERLLREVTRHRDAWPFLQPVSADEVPDYLSVVARPMDLGAVCARLAAGDCRPTATDLLSDLALVLANCYLYNADSHPVAKAGARLERFVVRRCAELGLPPLPSTDPSLLPEPAHAPPEPPAHRHKRARLTN